MKRTARIAAAAAALLVAFGAGAVVGTITAASGDYHTAASPTGVIDQAEHTIESQAARPVPAAVLQRAAIQGMLRALGDQWASYYTPGGYQQFTHVLAGDYSGVGVWVRRTTAGQLLVTSVQPRSPAAQAGLQRGDVLVTIDGRSVAGQDVSAVVTELRGRPGSRVAVQVRRNGALLREELRRSPIQDDDVHAAMITPTVERLRISAFTQGVGSWVRSEVAAAQALHLHGIVLDLRNDPGGLLDEAVETASAFLSGGPVVTYVRRGNHPQQLDALGRGNTTMPTVVLVNGGTASAAEIVAGALQDRHRAVVVGSRTFGKGSVQQPDQLSDGSALELTVGHYLTPSGRSLDGVGLEPDITVPAGSPTSVLDARALEVLSGLTADAGSAGRG